MAAAFFAEQIANLADSVEVSSAGLHAGEIAGTGEVPPEVVEVMAAYGIDVTGHRSRALTRPILADADLIVGMSRRHVQEIVLLDPPSWPKAFMLKELVRRGTSPDLVDPTRGSVRGSMWPTGTGLGPLWPTARPPTKCRTPTGRVWIGTGELLPTWLG